MRSLFIRLFIYFFLFSLSTVATVVTDGLRGLGIDGEGILSLFPDIFPLSGYLLSTPTREEDGAGRREESDTLLYSF